MTFSCAFESPAIVEIDTVHIVYVQKCGCSGFLLMGDAFASVIARIYAAWQRDDVEGVLLCCDHDIFYEICREEGVEGPGGEMFGKPEISRYLTAHIEVWDTIYVKHGPLDICGDEVRETTRFCVRHRDTNQIMEGTKRHEWRMRNGLVVYCREYQDTRKINAFLQMVGAKS